MDLIRVTKMIVSPLLAVGIIATAAGPTLATASTGFTPTPVGRGTDATPTNISIGGIEFESDSVDFITSTIHQDAPASSGWHTHPGLVLVTVLSGSVVMYDATCAATVIPAGTSFIESGDSPGLIRNESTTVPVDVVATYIVPSGTPADALRVDAANPGCTES